MEIPFVNLKAQYETIKTEVEEAIRKVIARTAFVGGPFAKEFEENFASFCGAKHSVGVGNGTDAIEIALKSLGIGPGDEVITAANSFIATSEAITQAGARVVFCDVEPKTFNIDPDLIEGKITEKTKAIAPVHLYGRPAEMDRINEIAKKHKLLVVEDAAQAHGVKYRGKRAGTLGDMACFSFYPGKNLGAYGDAGVIVTDNEEWAVKARMIADHGRISKYDHEFEGVNSRLDGIQGAVLNVKLKYIDEWNRRRHQNACLYRRCLEDVEEVILPDIPEEGSHVFHLFVVRLKDREKIQLRLKEKGIATGIHYPIALPNLKAYRYLGHQPEDFPVASRYQDEILSLPIFPELIEEQVKYITENLKAALSA